MNQSNKTPKTSFIKSLGRNLQEMKVFRKSLYLAFLFTVFAAILTSIAPSKLSDLADEISKSLTVDFEEMGKVSQEIGVNLQKENPQDIEYDGKIISLDDQKTYINILSELKENNISLDENAELSEDQQAMLLDSYKKFPQSIINIVEPSLDMDAVWSIVKLLIVIYVGSFAFSYIHGLIMAEVTNDYAKQLRSDVSAKINKLPLNYFDTNQIGDILSRMINDVDQVSFNLGDSLGTIVSSTALLLGSVVMMFKTNWMLALIAILSSLFGFLFTGIIIGKSQKYFRQRQKVLGDINGHTEEIISGVEVVKIYNAKEETEEKFDELNDTLFSSSVKSKFLSNMLQPFMNFIGNFGYLAVSIAGAIFVSKGYIKFGVIVAFMTYVRLFTNPLSRIAQALSALQASAAASDRVFEFMDEAELTDESHINNYLDPHDVEGEIEFKDVVFQYPSNDEPTIKGFSAKALPGQKIAIVGPTGAGKSTMVNLLMKFYEISQGDILIDGNSIHNISRENIHDLFTMILQDTWLFHGSVRENIVYNMKDISDDELTTLLKFIGLTHFVKTLPEGLDTVIKSNDSVSAGQRQLLTIARGMLKDAPFLILDEATSNVDTRTEEVIQEAMDKLMYGKTSFIIAHRLSTIVNADLILVMKDGNIIEQGTHEELLDQKGFYADLYNSQFSLN